MLTSVNNRVQTDVRQNPGVEVQLLVSRMPNQATLDFIDRMIRDF
jgi:hypothetical protein